MHLKILSAKWQPFCPEGDELKTVIYLPKNPFLLVGDSEKWQFQKLNFHRKLFHQSVEPLIYSTRHHNDILINSISNMLATSGT